MLAFCLSPLSTVAQDTDEEGVSQEKNLTDYQPPSLRRLRMEKVEDFERYEPQILEAIQFIKSTPINTTDERRDKAIRFFFRWLDGSASAIIEVNPYVGTLIKKNEGLFVLFFTGWTEFVLNDKSQKRNYLDANVAGVESVLTYYQKGEKFGIRKDKQVIQMLKLQQEGKLKEFIQKATGLEEFVPEEEEVKESNDEEEKDSDN